MMFNGSRCGGLVSDVLDIVGLRPMMRIESGREDLAVAILDGPVHGSHPELSDARLRWISSCDSVTSSHEESAALRHGTFIAGILSAKRSSGAPGICPGCTLLVRPIFTEKTDSVMPRATVEDLASAIVDSIGAGARVVNISAALSPVTGRELEIEEALRVAAVSGALVVAAVGNDASVGSSPLTRHPGVIPVAACDVAGRVPPSSNLTRSLGARGIVAPGVLTSISTTGPLVTRSGTSYAAAVVSGACALLWSAFPGAAAHEVRQAIVGPGKRTSTCPPRLNSWAAYHHLLDFGTLG
ncbi:S8 family serine peptidase [Streptomyces sp. NBC_01356]|uniref:S8 family serine peptidase n=1 Tax=Streptomyces sp. NBC_01356 TaxID=2903836 RepID=UPI003FCE292F